MGHGGRAQGQRGYRRGRGLKPQHNPQPHSPDHQQTLTVKPEGMEAWAAVRVGKLPTHATIDYYVGSKIKRDTR